MGEHCKKSDEKKPFYKSERITQIKEEINRIAHLRDKSTRELDPLCSYAFQVSAIGDF